MATIENYVFPQKLYRYRSVSENYLARELDAIANGYLYCSPYTSLNDPMEGFFSTSRRVRQSEGHRALRRAVIENKARVGICSFSEIHDHELMWAHYADQFKGICVSYSVSKLLRHLPQEAILVRVHYNETVPSIRRKDEPAHLAKRILSCKGYRWLYEREWRAFAHIGRLHYERIDCVSRVYLGSRIPEAARDEITRTMDRLNITVRQMAVGKYSLSFEAPANVT